MNEEVERRDEMWLKNNIYIFVARSVTHTETHTKARYLKVNDTTMR